MIDYFDKVSAMVFRERLLTIILTGAIRCMRAGFREYWRLRSISIRAIPYDKVKFSESGSNERRAMN